MTPDYWRCEAGVGEIMRETDQGDAVRVARYVCRGACSGFGAGPGWFAFVRSRPRADGEVV